MIILLSIYYCAFVTTFQNQRKKSSCEIKFYQFHEDNSGTFSYLSFYICFRSYDQYVFVIINGINISMIDSRNINL